MLYVRQFQKHILVTPLQVWKVCLIKVKCGWFITCFTTSMVHKQDLTSKSYVILMLRHDNQPVFKIRLIISNCLFNLAVKHSPVFFWPFYTLFMELTSLLLKIACYISLQIKRKSLDRRITTPPSKGHSWSSADWSSWQDKTEETQDQTLDSRKATGIAILSDLFQWKFEQLTQFGKRKTAYLKN